MISLEDCIELCGLTEDEVLAIAQHPCCEARHLSQIRYPDRRLDGPR